MAAGRRFNLMNKKTINLALQGGGAHGALTWGVLDRLLEEDRLEVEGITATSAGAMNAAVMKAGLMNGGREAAQTALTDFWLEVARKGAASNPVMNWLTTLNPLLAPLADAQAQATYFAGDQLSRVFSPYDLNPLNVHPLRDMLDALDFSQICTTDGPDLFICATNVRTGKIKVFEGDEISTDAILASACLPTLFQAVDIKDPVTGQMESYWDGGYIGNPALFPLFYKTQTQDILIVHINPIERNDVPRDAQSILNRVNEISFNSSLLRELRAIDFVKRLIDDGTLQGRSFKDVLIHSIRDDATMAALSVATKLSPDRALLEDLRDKGRVAADTFLTNHWGDLGERSSVDLRGMFS